MDWSLDHVTWDNCLWISNIMVVSNLLCTMGIFGFGNVRFVKILYNRCRVGIFFDEISTFNYYIFFLKMEFFSQMCTQCRPLLNCCSKFFDDILRSNLSLLSRLNPWEIIEFSLDLDTLMSVPNSKSIVFKRLNLF